MARDAVRHEISWQFLRWMMSTVYLGLGTNLGDRMVNLNRAMESLSEEVRITAVSPVYETEAWGIEEQPDFLNMCLSGETDLSPDALLLYVKQLELQLGRIAAERWGPRLIDIDILFYDQSVLEGAALTIPHVGVAERASVLVPLADIAPDMVHPILLKPISEILQNVEKSGVRLY